MTDPKLLNKIIEIVFETPDGEWNETVDAIYACVRGTDYYKQLEERQKVFEQEQKIKELKNKQKRAEEEAQRLMIVLQQLEEELKK
jgi:hypothetical protein